MDRTEIEAEAERWTAWLSRIVQSDEWAPNRQVAAEGRTREYLAAEEENRPWDQRAIAALHIRYRAEDAQAEAALRH